MDYLRVGTTDSNLSSVKCPSSLNWGKITVSDENAGRVKKNAKMYVKKVADKVQLSLQWNGTNGEDTAKILQAFDHEYIFVRYLDPKTNEFVVKEFYPGDFSAPVYCYWKEGVMCRNIAFDIIER